jgi:uncharacterized protein YndB with AHSA1/START domain
MTNTEKITGAARMSDEAVQAKTGHTWPEWFAILDAAGAQQMSHKQIVAYLHGEHAVGPWWQQMVTVAYEQERGLRDKHQMPDGYQISVNKTIAATVAATYAAWEDQTTRQRWLSDALTIRKATPDKSIRTVWADGVSRVDVGFAAKGDGKTQVTVQHSKLADADTAAQMKTYWAAALDRLKGLLED